MVAERRAPQSVAAISADAKAAVLAAKAGPKQAAAKKYLDLRKKQQKAAEYLAAKKRKEQK